MSAAGGGGTESAWTLAPAAPAAPDLGALAPCLRLTAPLPAAARAECARRLPLLHTGRRPSDLLLALRPRMPNEVAQFLAELGAFVHAGALWLTDGAVLERRRLPEGEPDGRWALPDRAALLQGLRPAGLAPLAALGAGRLLFVAAGWDADHQRREALVVLDPSRADRWLALRPASEGTVVCTGRASVQRTDDPDRFTLTQVVGGAAHLDEYFEVTSRLELDLQRGLASPAAGRSAGPCPPLASTLGRAGAAVAWAAVPATAPLPARPGLLARIGRALAPARPPLTTFLGTPDGAPGVPPLLLELRAPATTCLEPPFLAVARAEGHVLCLDLFAGTHATLRLWRLPGPGRGEA